MRVLHADEAEAELRCARAGFREEQIIKILKEKDAGAKLVDLCLRHGISEQTSHRTLNSVDHFSRALAIAVDRSLPGERVVRELDELVAVRGVPEMIVADNGPELAGKALKVGRTAALSCR